MNEFLALVALIAFTVTGAGLLIAGVVHFAVVGIRPRPRGVTTAAREPETQPHRREQP